MNLSHNLKYITIIPYIAQNRIANRDKDIIMYSEEVLIYTVINLFNNSLYNKEDHFSGTFKLSHITPTNDHANFIIIVLKMNTFILLLVFWPDQPDHKLKALQQEHPIWCHKILPHDCASYSAYKIFFLPSGDILM